MSAHAQPNEQAPPREPATMLPLASTAEPMPVPIDSRMASDMPARRAGAGLGQQRDLRVVADADAQVRKQRLHVEPVEIGQVRYPAAGRPLDQPGHGKADRFDVARLGAQRGQPVDERGAVRRRLLMHQHVQRRRIAGVERGAHVGAAEVDGQHAGH